MNYFGLLTSLFILYHSPACLPTTELSVTTGLFVYHTHHIFALMIDS